MEKQYVEQRDGGYWVADSRVSLDSIVYAFLDGRTPESIAQSFPVISLEQVYGAIAFYLANQGQIDVYLAQARDDFDAKRLAARGADPAFYQKFAAARRQNAGPVETRSRHERR